MRKTKGQIISVKRGECYDEGIVEDGAQSNLEIKERHSKGYDCLPSVSVIFNLGVRIYFLSLVWPY